MKLVIIDTLVATDQYRFRWETALAGLKSDIPEITDVDYITFKRIENNEFAQLNGYSEILRLMTTMLNRLNDNVIFLFPNANNIIAPIIKEYKYLYKKNFKLVGFWNDGAFYQHGSYRFNTIGSDHTWIRDLERTLTKVYDLNLVPPEIPMISFKRYVTPLTKNKIIRCNYPFDYAIKEIQSKINPNSVKTNTIILTGKDVTEQSLETVQVAKRTFDKFEVFPLYSDIYSKEEYYRILSNAKGAMSLSLADTSPYSLVECMAMGCVPILPRMPVYEGIFPEQFFFNPKALKPPFLNFIRYGEELAELIETLFVNYNSLYNEKHYKEIVEKYYSSNQLKEIICNLIK